MISHKFSYKQLKLHPCYAWGNVVGSDVNKERLALTSESVSQSGRRPSWMIPDPCLRATSFPLRMLLTLSRLGERSCIVGRVHGCADVA